MGLCFLLTCLILAVSPASALFLAGQSPEGGEVSILCEGQSRAYVAAPDGMLRSLALDQGGQAKFYPQSQGPHTIQCGGETRTIEVYMPRQPGELAQDEVGWALPAAVASAAFAAILLFALKKILGRKTEFTKRVEKGTATISIFASEELRQVRVNDPGGGPLELYLPRLAAGASWSYEYECGTGGENTAPAMLYAQGRNGEVAMISDPSIVKGKTSAKSLPIGALGKKATPPQRHLSKYPG